MNIYEIWLACALISNREKIHLINNYNCAENLWNKVIERNETNNIYPSIINKLQCAWNIKNIEDISEYIKVKEIRCAVYNSIGYPKRLSELEDAPYVLFYMGDIEVLDSMHSVSIVGSRGCTHYGMDAARIISSELAKNNIAVISGMARGIDSIAHKCCIENNGFTAAILGCGIDIIYPKENNSLFKQICKSGCVISEFLPGTPPNSYNFPKRNRIISALSDVVVIVEAGEKSGTLITASAALEQGKDIFAVPGSIFSEHSKGTNKLIKDGAYPFTSMEDIFSILKLEYAANQYQKEENNPILSGEQQKINSILCNKPIHIDDIIRITNIDIQVMYEVLFEMQLRNEIRCLAGNYYVKINEKI
jgi:DNA processing protein